jgi:hypothetical protein
MFTSTIIHVNCYCSGFSLVPFFCYQMCVIPAGSWSKVLQMWALYRDGHPGQVSVATWSVSAYGCLGE